MGAACFSANLRRARDTVKEGGAGLYRGVDAPLASWWACRANGCSAPRVARRWRLAEA